MAAKRKTVPTPLHLLEELSDSLLAHLEQACIQAQADTEKLLLKLDKQRGKALEKLENARQGFDEAVAAGKASAQRKAHARIEKFESVLAVLQESDQETRAYLAQLKADIQSSLRLARQYVGKAGEAAAKSLAAREQPAKARARTPRAAATLDAAQQPVRRATARAKPKASAGT